jgi:hypothetical protein
MSSKINASAAVPAVTPAGDKNKDKENNEKTTKKIKKKAATVRELEQEAHALLNVPTGERRIMFNEINRLESTADKFKENLANATSKCLMDGRISWSEFVTEEGKVDWVDGHFCSKRTTEPSYQRTSSVRQYTRVLDRVSGYFYHATTVNLLSKALATRKDKYLASPVGAGTKVVVPLHTVEEKKKFEENFENCVTFGFLHENPLLEWRFKDDHDGWFRLSGLLAVATAMNKSTLYSSGSKYWGLLERSTTNYDPPEWATTTPAASSVQEAKSKEALASLLNDIKATVERSELGRGVHVDEESSDSDDLEDNYADAITTTAAAVKTKETNESKKKATPGGGIRRGRRRRRIP